MRLVERFSIIVFSIIVFILSVLSILISVDIVSVDIFSDIFSKANENNTVAICLCLLFAIWSIANIFFKSDSNSDVANGVLLENENGSLLITKESISNMVDSVIKKNQDIKDASVKIEFDDNRDIAINIVAIVKDNVVVKDTFSRLQDSIKLTIKRTTDLDVSNVNIKLKNVEQEKKGQVQ